MLNTFEALADYGKDEGQSGDNVSDKTQDNAAVDVSSLINRINEMETKVNQLLNRATDFPTRGKEDDSNGDNNAVDNGNNTDGGNNNANQADS